jgi:Putative DNA-binding domain
MVWDEQQTLFGKALLDPSSEVPDFVAKTAGGPSSRRFNVYRNNVMVSLTEAIISSYPVVFRLVGDEFATTMARVYAGDNLPTTPVLFEYGGDYGDFIEQFEPAKSLPYLADLARLEWAWLCAYHSADHQSLAIDALAQYGEDELMDLCFSFCPGVALLRSEFPIVSIWSAHQGEEIDVEHLKRAQTGEGALVNRPEAEVLVRTLEPATHAFFTSLQGGFSLGVSIDKGNTFHDFDAAEAISALFETKTVAAIK